MTKPLWRPSHVNDLGENKILVHIFLDHSQFGPYIFIAVNLVYVIFNLESI